MGVFSTQLTAATWEQNFQNQFVGNINAGQSVDAPLPISGGPAMAIAFVDNLDGAGATYDLIVTAVDVNGQGRTLLQQVGSIVTPNMVIVPCPPAMTRLQIVVIPRGGGNVDVGLVVVY